MWRRRLQAESCFKTGQRAALAGRLTEAEAAFDRALAICPDFAPAVLHKAIVLADRSDHRRALDWAGRAVALAPRRAAYRIVQGRVAYDAGNDPAAAAAFDAACRLSPSNRLAAAYRLLVRIRRGLPRPEDDDLDGLDRLLSSTHPAFQARWLALCETALAALAPRSRSLALQMIGAAHLTPQSEASSVFYQRWWRGWRAFAARATAFGRARREAWALEREAEAHLKAAHLDAALDCLERALAVHGRNDDLADRYLDLCLYRGRYGPILEELGSAADRDDLEQLATRPSGAQAAAQIDGLILLALVRFHQGRWPAAISLFGAAAGADRHDYLAPYFLGVALLAVQRPREALAWFTRALGVINPQVARLRLQEWRRCR